MRTITLLVLILTLGSVVCQTGNYTPVVLWPGLGETGYIYAIKMKIYLTENLPGIYVLKLRLTDTIEEAWKFSYRKHPNLQIKIACDIISKDPNLSAGFNAIGLSQGSQFMRGLVQRCPEAKVKNLITLGGQHQGIYGLPQCRLELRRTCNLIRKLLNSFAYYEWVQNCLVPATYWHDPFHEKTYKKYSTFLADINNEMKINSDYVRKLQSLENFVMVKFLNDTVVQPLATQWFGFYKPRQSVETQNLQESALFLEDRLGLQKMNKEHKLHFLAAEGDHRFKDPSWFVENIVNIFLK